MKTGKEILESYLFEVSEGKEVCLSDHIDKAMQEAVEEQHNETRQSCSEVCGRLAYLMENGAGEIDVGDRLRQAQRGCIKTKAI